MTRAYDDISSAIDGYIEQAAGNEPQADPRSAEQPEYEQESDYDDTDTPEYLAGIYARAQAAEREASAAHDTQLDRQIRRRQEAGCGCHDGNHFDERGPLEIMVELGTDFDRASEVWHDRTFSWDTRSKARTETDPKIDPYSAYEKVNALEDIDALKKKYTVKRDTHRGRIEDDPRLDAVLERALGPVRGNALPNDRALSR